MPQPNGAQNSGKRREPRSASGSQLPLFEIPGKGKAFVDLQNDVTASDVRLAQREGFESVEHLKRYTTLGMAADQGKTSNLNGLTILAEGARPADPRRRHDALPPALQSRQPRRARRPRARRPHRGRSAARRSTTGTSRPAPR